MSKCQAYQTNEQMICPACGLGWDANDTNPPQCGQTGLSARRASLSTLRARFERHAAKEGLSLARHAESYASPLTIAAWVAYQAGYALPRL